MNERHYPSAEYLVKLAVALQTCYTNSLPETMKQKRQKALYATYHDRIKDKPSIYDLQWEVRKHIAPIQVSHLLGCNEVIIPHLTTEYAELKQACHKFKPVLLTLKKHQELFSLVKPLVAMLEKDFDAAMDKDIKHLNWMFAL